MKQIYFISLGCDKNLVDSEHLLYDLSQKGYVLVDLPQEADVILVNTCCFIGDALEESINTVIEMGQFKSEGKALVICGCMAQRFFDEIENQLPEVDAVVGVHAYDQMADAIELALQGKKQYIKSDESKEQIFSGRYRTQIGASAYLKIADGCQKYCSYCIIPYVRGAYQSVPIETLYTEAKELVSLGVKELCLVAQEITCYGIDLYQKKMLVPLLQKLSSINDLRWIRLLYAYPEEIEEDLIQEMASNPKICHYIDMPIQHCEDQILQRMGRKTDRKSIENTIQKLRLAMPDIAIRTTLLVGFPGETEQDFECLLDFIRKMRFSKLGAFPYSREEGTKAYNFPEQIEDEMKQTRYRRVMETQQMVAFSKEKELIGSNLLTMVEGYLPEDDVYVGRSQYNAPEIDGLIFIRSDRKLTTGDFVNVFITSSLDYDLCGEIKDESSQ